MNKNKKTFLLTLLFAVVVIVAGKVFADIRANGADAGKISVNKTAVVDEDDSRKANVTLSVSGNAFTTSSTLDVVLIIDRSQGMDDRASSNDNKSKIVATKEAAIELATELLSNNTDDETLVRMGIVTFGSDVIEGYDYYEGLEFWNTTYKVITSNSLTSNVNAITTLINDIPNTVGGFLDGNYVDSQGTNIQAGLARANSLLSSSQAQNKVVILLTDGEPTCFTHNGNVVGTKGDDSAVCIKLNASDANCTNVKPSDAAKSEANTLKDEDGLNATLYTIGFGLGNNTNAINFLNNVATNSSKAYLADNVVDLLENFDDITESITAIANDVVVTDIVPVGFEVDESAIKAIYGDKVEITTNDDGTTTIVWNIGTLFVTNDEVLSYQVRAKDDYYGGMYTNGDAVLIGTAVGNPAYPNGEIEEVFPVPVTAIAMKTVNDNYSTKLGEQLNINAADGILSNDSTNKMTDGEGTTVVNEIIVKSASCGNVSDITVNEDGSFGYTPNSSCYVGESSQVVFEYEVKSIVTINGESQVVTSNVSTITINLTKDEASVDGAFVTKTSNGGNTTTNINGPFSYTIEYTSVLENHIGNTVVTIVDTLPYQLDETKNNELDGGVYDAITKTITWVETIENINSYNEQNNSINIEKSITVFYKDVPTDVEKIVNNASVVTDIDNIPVNGTSEIEVVRGTVVVDYVDNLGNTLLESTTSLGLVNSDYTTNANNIINVSGVEYQLVATKVNGEEVTKTNNYNGQYILGTTTVTYVYYKVTGDIDNNQTVFTKEGPNSITTSDSEFEYAITYGTKIDDYIGSATVTIVDTLPYEIDATKNNELDGGVYDAANKTITWVVTINDINTYENGTYDVNIVKNIKVVFAGLNANNRTLTNNANVKLETSKSSVEKETSEVTDLAINGYVVAHYIDINGNTILDDFKANGLVGNDYVTSVKNIDGYQLVEIRGNSTGKYIDGVVEVTYVYYEVKGNISGDSVTKSGTEEVNETDADFDYEITYNATISDYIGNATVTIVDTLPYMIDTTKAYELDGGVYDATTKTITWVETIEGIDTNVNGAYVVRFVKNIKVSYVGLEATTREVINKVVGTMATSVTNKTTKEATATTGVKVSGQVTAYYVDTNGDTVAEDVVLTGLVGDSYATSAETITGYKLVETNGNSTGSYTVEDIYVTYVYYKVEGNVSGDELVKSGTEEVNATDASFNYEIKYNTIISDYIGNATVTIVDTLPYEIDITKTYELDGGVYDATTKTITWVETIEGIDTNVNGGKAIEIVKNIQVTYSGVEATIRKVSNSVVATITTDVKEKTTDPAVKETLVKVSGNVITHYVDTEGNTIKDDTKITGLVGDSYVTSSKNIDGYQLVEVKGNTTGSYTVEDIYVTYVYYKETGEIVSDTITKIGTEEVNETDAIFNYEIKYNSIVKNYIGNATVTIVDTLPYEIDTTKAYELDGGVYDATTKTITWVETVEGIDTNANGDKVVEFVKNIQVTYSGLEATTREVTNSVVATIVNDVTERTTAIVEATTAVKVSSNVLVHFVDTEGNTIEEGINISDLVGNGYVTEAKEITGYELVEVIGNATGIYTVEDINVTYVYYRETGNITSELIDKTGTEEILLKDEKVSYTIDYKGNIDNYIGNAVVWVIDYLPCAIDLTASDLAGGIYNEEDMTITWVITIADINTYKNGTYKIELTKELLLTYKDLDLIADKITNNVSVTVKTDVSEEVVEDEFDTEVNVEGSVVINYVDDEGNLLVDETVINGKIGTEYETELREFTDYILVEIFGDVSGVYTEDEQMVTYVYTYVGKGGDVEELPPQTGRNDGILLFEVINVLIIGLFLFIKKFI